MKKILMVEDNGPMIETMRAALELRGHEVTVAETVRAALEQMGGERVPFVAFDVLLIDHELPDGIGATLLRAFGDVPRPERPKTIYWSGLDRSRELAELDLVPDVLLTKEKTIECLTEIEA